jgi:hypothetical protein
MTNFGVVVSRFRESTDSLRRFDQALMFFKRNVNNNPQEREIELEKMLAVLKPISEMLNGRLSNAMDFDEHEVLEILQSRHTEDWQGYKTRLLMLVEKLTARETDFVEEDFQALNDVADAVDAQCATLFKKISGRV